MTPVFLRRLADALTLARALLGLPLIFALAEGKQSLAWVLFTAWRPKRSGYQE